MAENQNLDRNTTTTTTTTTSEISSAIYGTPVEAVDDHASRDHDGIPVAECGNEPQHNMVSQACPGPWFIVYISKSTS